MSITGSDGASIQLLDHTSQCLTFGATKGLDAALVAQFAQVDAKSGSSCGRALAFGKRSVVEFDVPPEEDPDGSASRSTKSTRQRSPRST